jgi:RNA polymerase sigma factor (sigma-70 family)
MKIAANACRSAITAHKVSAVRSTKFEKLAIGQPKSDSCDITLDPEDSIDMASQAAIKAECQHMLACIDRLPKQRQTVLRMRYLEHLSYSQIAAELDISESAARTSVSQAIVAARSEMDQYSLPGFE